MKAIVKQIPNFITCLNLVSGCIACVMALNFRPLDALIWIIIAAVLDFFDGFLARMLKTYSPIGKDLDSLADVVSFGVAPGMMVFYVLSAIANEGEYKLYSLGFFAFIIPALSAVRLARFNNDTRQKEHFIGLPVPAHALLWGSVVYFFNQHPDLLRGNSLLLTIVGIIAITAVSLLLVSDIPMFSLKIKSLGWEENKLRYILLVVAVIFLITLGLAGIAPTILFYILLSYLTAKNIQE